MNPLHAQTWHAYELAMKNATCKVAIDIGANDGGYTATLRANGFKVIAFEPVPKMFGRLYERFKNDPEVRSERIALSDKIDLIQNCRVMHAWTLGDPDKVGMSVSPDHKDDPSFTMYCDTLDNQLDIYGIRQVGMIKLDVDGYEFRVLRGAEKTLRRDRPPILCEFSEYIVRLGESPEAFVNFIFDLGYKVVSLDAKYECTRWDQVAPHWPVHGSFDVMLLPR